jgi:hypothetical protein
MQIPSFLWISYDDNFKFDIKWAIMKRQKNNYIYDELYLQVFADK